MRLVFMKEITSNNDNDNNNNRRYDNISIFFLPPYSLRMRLLWQLWNFFLRRFLRRHQLSRREQVQWHIPSYKAIPIAHEKAKTIWEPKINHIPSDWGNTRRHPKMTFKISHICVAKCMRTIPSNLQTFLVKNTWMNRHLFCNHHWLCLTIVGIVVCHDLVLLIDYWFVFVLTIIKNLQIEQGQRAIFLPAK